MSEYRRASLSVVLMLVMTFACFAVLATPQAAATENVGLETAAKVDWKTNELIDPASKISPALAESMKGSTGPFKVHVYISDREAVNAYLGSKGLPLVKGFELPGLPTPRVMELSSSEIEALAANPGIAWVEPYVAPVYDTPVIDPDLDEALKTDAVSVIEDYDVDDVHGAVEAWSMGWTGDGVKIAVIDTGFDMAHPDLQGQQARYETGGPYDGWPIVYDDLAAAYWSMGEIGGWVADTSYMSPDYGGYVEFYGRYYDISDLKDVSGNPVSSQSGWYKLGYHPDANLAALMGEPVAVLVVDSTIPGVYDTVYVDVLDDRSFSNDKACTQGDEISYFDYYDATTGTSDFSSWDAGDGFADLSGGMIYWISDGANVLPGSDWMYGASWVPESGDAVAFVGEFSLYQSHGTMTASAALAQGRTLGGQLMGMAPDAKLILIPMTYDYVASWLFAELGADGYPYTGDEANIVSNSYGFSDMAIAAGYNMYDLYAGYISNYFGDSLWMWSTGNGGPGYGTSKTPTDFNAVHVGAGTTMQYRYQLGYEPYLEYTKWGDVAPFSNSGPSRTGKLNAEIIASGMYSLEPAPLNQVAYGGIGDGSMHFQIGSGTSHATPTVAGGAALGYQAYKARTGAWPEMDMAKARLMASADDMHFDPFKQGAGWLNASAYAKAMAMGDSGAMATSLLMRGWTETWYTKAALYPGFVYGKRYETFPNLLRPGEYDAGHIVETINWDQIGSVEVNVTSGILLRTGSDLVRITTPDAGSQFVDLTGYVPPTTDLLRVTMYFPLSQFDPELDYETDVYYMLELFDWVDFNHDGRGWNSTTSGELFRYVVDGSECNYNQVMLKDPMERSHDGLIARIRAVMGAPGTDISLQLDYYELQTFPWIQLRMFGETDWYSRLNFTLPPGDTADWEVNVSIPSDAPVGSYAAGIYVDYGYRVQCIPVVINVAADDYEFEFGGPSAFDTPYNNDFQGLADKAWRFEVGDWRMFWAEPSWMPPSTNAYLAAIVNWTELPTDVNMHILAPRWDAEWNQWVWPLGPGWLMYPIASSDERYMGGGIFGVYTNTGRAQESLSVPFGRIYYNDLGTPAPFAILTRCPVMSGNSSSDTLQGYTTWFTMNGYSPQSISLWAPQPGPVQVAGTIPGWYDVTVDGQVEVRGGGVGPYSKEMYWWQYVYQDYLTGDFFADLANAMYTRTLWVEDSSLLDVETWEEFGAPDIDLGLWYDADMDGIAELSEPFWYSGTAGSNEHVRVNNPSDGQWIIKVLGYTVTGFPGYFDMQILKGVSGYIRVTDLASPVSSGMHSFNVTYSVPMKVGTYEGYATFGFYGADDTFPIYFEIAVLDYDAPRIEDLTPANGTELGTNRLDIHFRVNDSPFDSPISWFTVWLDGAIDVLSISTWSIDPENQVSISFPYALADGMHTLEIWVSDASWNYGYAYAKFKVNTVIERFDARFVDPSSGLPIRNGATVGLSSVDIEGCTDPNAFVYVYAATSTYWTQADPEGNWSIPGVPLAEGLNMISVETETLGGVTASKMMALTSDTICRLWVADVPSPTASTAITVRGWTDQDAHLTVNGAAVPVAPDGSFAADVLLSEGSNTIYVNATDAVGNSAHTTLVVERDTTAPAIVILGPADGSNTSVPNIVVYGTTEPGATVYVNGVLASNGSANWSATIALVEGWNAITVSAVDALGNSASESIAVEYIPPVYVTPEELQAVQNMLSDMLDELAAALAENVTALQAQLDALSAALGENVTALQDQIDALNAQLATDIAALQSLIDALETALGENVTALQDRIDAISAALEENMTDLAGTIADLQAQLNAVLADITALQDSLAQNVSDLQTQLGENVTALQDQIDALNAQLATDIAALQSLIDALETALGENVTALQDQIDAISAALLEGNMTDLAGTIADLQAQLNAVLADIAALQDSLAQNVSGLQSQLNEAMDEIAGLEGDLDHLQSELDNLDQALQERVDVVENQAADTDAFASMLLYLTALLFAIAIALIGVVYWLVNAKIKGGSGGASSMEEVETGPSEVEKEFEELEKEIKREEK